nr:putative salivary protein [Nilaparvata lugens]
MMFLELLISIVALSTLTNEIYCKDLEKLANWDAFETDLGKTSVVVLFLCPDNTQQRCLDLTNTLKTQCDSHSAFMCTEYINYIPNDFTNNLGSGEAIPYIAFFKDGNKIPVIELKETDDTSITDTDIDDAFKDSKLN